MTETSYAGAEIERSQDQSTSDAVKGKAQEVTSQVAEKATDLREQASSRARDELNSRSTQAAGQVTAIAQALRRTSGQLREEGQSQPAQWAEAAGDKVERLGIYLGEADADRMLHDAESFARRRTWLVAAGGMVIGLAASRLLKASSSRRYASDGDGRSQSLPNTRGSYAELPSGDSYAAAGEPRRHPPTGV